MNRHDSGASIRPLGIISLAIVASFAFGTLADTFNLSYHLHMPAYEAVLQLVARRQLAKSPGDGQNSSDILPEGYRYLSFDGRVESDDKTVQFHSVCHPLDMDHCTGLKFV